MGRRKHAWSAFYEEMYGESPRDPESIRMAERGIELATTEEFIDDFYERIGPMLELVRECGNPQIHLGMELLLLELRRHQEDIL